jgi:hypothetical protein
MPMLPKGPVTVAMLLYKGWQTLPPQQRKQVLELARQHGPTVAAKAALASKKAAGAVGKRPPAP